MRPSSAVLVRDLYLYRTALPGARIRAKLRGSCVHDERGMALATVVVRSSAGRWGARALGAAGFTGATVALMSLVGGWAAGAWLLALAVPGLLLLSLALVLVMSPEPGYALLSEDGETLLLVEPESRAGLWRRSRIEDGEGQRLGALRRAPLRDRFWPLGHVAPLVVIEPEGGGEIRAQRPSSWAPGWVFASQGQAVARYAIRTAPGTRDRLEVGDETLDPRLLLAAVLVARP